MVSSQKIINIFLRPLSGPKKFNYNTLVIFNYFILNSDLHPRTFSFVFGETRKLKL